LSLVIDRGPFGPGFLRILKYVHSCERDLHALQGDWRSHLTLRIEQLSQGLFHRPAVGFFSSAGVIMGFDVLESSGTDPG
jgi:hypothetical protein